ncbi:MAG: aminotransferase class III-fold pyridoxal phosphate-dependent enzyme [Hyphomicrobiales bacterium]|nr:MAG: aminotransferase class III-fold pyridoxal phosphate-dependent enzyme [Hyphomicrobiales bacterium]
MSRGAGCSSRGSPLWTQDCGGQGVGRLSAGRQRRQSYSVAISLQPHPASVHGSDAVQSFRTADMEHGMADKAMRERLKTIRDREAADFTERRPRSADLSRRARSVMPDGVPMAWMAGLHRHAPLFVAGGEGSTFVDVDGNSYVDFNLADLSNTAGFGPNAVARAVEAQAARGMQFLLPGEDSILVATELAARTRMPFWQFTISASSANTEVIRIARALTGRRKIVMFDGKYHGHFDTAMTREAHRATTSRPSCKASVCRPPLRPMPSTCHSMTWRGWKRPSKRVMSRWSSPSPH